MRIREGKRYVTRDGRVTGPVELRDKPYVYAIYQVDIPSIGYKPYKENGRFWSKEFTHPLDLVAEYLEDGK